MSKPLIISPDTDFVMNGNVFQYSVVDGSIQLKRIGVYDKKVKVKNPPPTLDTCYSWFPDFPKELVKQAWDHYEDGKNEKGEWTDTNGKVVINHKQKMRTNWMKPERRIIETKTADNKPVMIR